MASGLVMGFAFYAGLGPEVGMGFCELQSAPQPSNLHPALGTIQHMDRSECAPRRTVAGIAIAVAFAPGLIAAPRGSGESEFVGLKKAAQLALLYAQDNSDTLPLAIGQRLDGSWWWNTLIPVPEDWKTSGWSDEETRARVAGIFPNSLRQYGSIDVLMGVPGFRRVRNSADATDFVSPNRPWTTCSFAMNGLLHSLQTAEVTRPDRLTLIWPSYGKASREGRIIANPTLRCDGWGPCQFNPSGPPVEGGSGGYAWWALNPRPQETASGPERFNLGKSGVPLANVDGSVRFVQVQGPRSRDGQRTFIQDRNNFPFAELDTEGNPATMWGCTSAGTTVAYACFFRPDNSFLP